MPSNVTPTRIATPDKVDDMQPMLVPKRLVGSDRDAKGCIPSAGYSWCERTKACERPWELANSQGFKSTEYNFGAWCNFKETK